MNPGGIDPGGIDPGGIAPGGIDPGGIDPGGIVPGGIVPGGVAIGKTEPCGQPAPGPPMLALVVGMYGGVVWGMLCADPGPPG